LKNGSIFVTTNKNYCMKKFLLVSMLSLTICSCISTKNTIKNIDNNAIKPAIIDNHLVISEYSNDKKYGYNKDYPINIGFNKENEAAKNIQYFFNALLGENNDKFTYKKMESCCPFPTTKTVMGAGTLDVYEVTFENSGKKVQLYFNIYEKGKIICPKGFIINNKSN
jgi:hypothetical protein